MVTGRVVPWFYGSELVSGLLVNHTQPWRVSLCMRLFCPSAESFPWLVFRSKLQGARCGWFCGLLKFFFNMLLVRRVCLVAMEMCAVGLSASPEALPPRSVCVPDWMVSESCWHTVGWEGGSVERAGRPWLAATNCTSSVLSEEKLAPVCGLREAQ